MSASPADSLAPAPRPAESAAGAVRADLRAALSELSETLAGEQRPDLAAVYESLRHTWILADLAELDEAADTLVKTVLRSLHRELRSGGETLDAPHFAHHLAVAADRL